MRRQAQLTAAERKQAASELAAWGTDWGTDEGLLVTALLGGGSSRTSMVGDEGLEPPTLSV